MRDIGLENVIEAGEILPVGGYICNIANVKDIAAQDYLDIEFDIAEGQYAGYYSRLFDSRGFWGGRFLKSYKEKAKPFFKALITTIEKSNPNYNFAYNEKSLVGKKIGLVLALEEYRGNDGVVKKRLYTAQVHTVDAIRQGRFEVPELKKLEGSQNLGTSSQGDFSQEIFPDDEVPF